MGSRTDCKCVYIPGALDSSECKRHNFIATPEGLEIARAQPAPVGRELRERIENYLGNGGLWNPEHMDHDKVRALLIDCRDYLATPDTLRERLEEFREALERCAVRPERGDTGYYCSLCSSRIPFYEDEKKLVHKPTCLLASAPTPAVTEYEQCHSNSPFCEKCGICHTEKFPCQQPAAPVEARAAFETVWKDAGLDDESFIDKDVAQSLWQAAEQAGMERAAQIAELYLNKSNIPPLTIEWQIMIREIRARALAHSTAIKRDTDVPSKT